jgi:hypothetical protein
LKTRSNLLHSEINRRDLLKISAGASSSLVFGGVGTGAFTIGDRALAQGTKRSAVLLIFLPGGYNALFGSADSFANRSFGVNNTNMLALSNGLVVDSSFNALGAFAKANLATVGINHGIPIHPQAQTAQFTVGAQNPVLTLAAAMGGSGSIKCANVGRDLIPGPRNAVNGVTLQTLTDMKTTIDALGGGTPDVTMPDRAIAANGVTAAQMMSRFDISGHVNSLNSAETGYPVAIETLKTPSQPFNPQTLQTAYTLNGTAVNDIKSKMAAAELAIRAGANVVTTVIGPFSGNIWDTHGDTSGNLARSNFTRLVLDGLKIFTERMLTEESEFNVTIAIFGDFARSLPGSDHATVTVATVMGHKVNQGTTGKVDGNVTFTSETPGVEGFWGYIATLAGAPQATIAAFGGNQHTRLTKV